MDRPAHTPDAPDLPKGEQTRNLLVETALTLFKEKGYDRTTMRAIATEAGVSVGNAYYYFASKEHLIQGFYERIQQLHVEACAPVLERETTFVARLDGVLQTWLDVAAPYHSFAAQFFKNAADPNSPLSPFSVESKPTRDAGIALFRTVLEGSAAKVDPELRSDLPELLWLFHMGVVLYWVHDRSENAEKARTLARRASPMLARMIQLSATRVFRPLTREAISLFREIGWFQR